MKLVQQSDSIMAFKSGRYTALFVGLMFVIVSGFLIYQDFKTVGFQVIEFWEFWFLLIFFISGILLVLFTQKRTITLDKNLKKIIISSKGIIGGSEKEYNIDNVIGMELIEEYRTATTQQGNTQIQRPEKYEELVLVMKDGSRLTLDSAPASSPIAAISGVPILKGREQPFSERIATFIGVPLNRVSAFGTERIVPPSGNISPTT